jgi:hypothetical protein
MCFSILAVLNSVDLPFAVVDSNADHLFLPPVSRKENIGTSRKRRLSLKSTISSIASIFTVIVLNDVNDWHDIMASQTSRYTTPSHLIWRTRPSDFGVFSLYLEGPSHFGVTIALWSSEH